MIGLTLCDVCRHSRRNGTCDAFPNRIPDDIQEGADHQAPYAGDHGIQFELDEDRYEDFGPALQSDYARLYGTPDPSLPKPA